MKLASAMNEPRHRNSDRISFAESCGICPRRTRVVLCTSLESSTNDGEQDHCGHSIDREKEVALNEALRQPLPASHPRHDKINETKDAHAEKAVDGKNVEAVTRETELRRSQSTACIQEQTERHLE